MRTYLVTVIMAICGVSTTHAQKPQYYWSNDSSTTAGGYEWRQSNGGKSQGIYYPSNFPHAPSGNIVNLYIKVASRTLASQSIYYNFTVKMGYTMADSFTNAPATPDTFKSGLTTVFSDASFVIPGTDTIGKWIKIPLNKSSFYYRGYGTAEARNLVVEFSFVGKPADGFLVRNSVGGHKRYLGGSVNDVASKGVLNYMLDLGFDFGAAIGVPEVVNISSLDLFPNPSTDGKFSISLETRTAVNQVKVAVTDVTGKPVFDNQYRNACTRFFQSIDAGILSKGLYFVRVEADEEAVTRKLMIQ